MMLEQYQTAFAKLRSDKKAYWPQATLYRAPHKPFMLFSVMDLIAQGIITTNLKSNITLRHVQPLFGALLWTPIIIHALSAASASSHPKVVLPSLPHTLCPGVSATMMILAMAWHCVDYTTGCLIKD